MEKIEYTPAGPTVEAFHASDSFVRGLMGPVGSSKSSACCVEIMSRAMRQAVRPNTHVRKTRFAILRNTYPELKSTTIKTWTEWFPFAVMKWDAPISSKANFYLPDKTKVECEVFFLALDRPDDIGKLKSLELTGAWMNEAGEMAKGVFDMLTQRVGRFPPQRWGGPTWTGVILDTNPPDDDSWYYTLAEEECPDSFKFFKQPGGLFEKDGKFLPNPNAENIQNLPGGHEYYLRQVAGKKREWIKVFLCGQYGTISNGRPVYSEYNDEVHCKEFDLYPNQPLILGFDYGLTPACIIGQVSPRGQLRIVDELCATDMGITQFARDVVKPHLSLNYPGYQIQACGDPAGLQRSQTEEKTCFMALAEQGIPAMPALTNDFLARREAVAGYLTIMIDGQPGFLIHPRCKTLRKGFNGGYCYERVNIGGERYKDRPSKDKFSHPHDGLQYLAMFTKQANLNADFGKKIVYPTKSGIV